MKRFLNSKTISFILVFFVCLFIGLSLSTHKPLWNDEIYTLINLNNVSYQQVLTGDHSEGNNFPLFYLMQKLLIDLSGYEIPVEWSGSDRDWSYAHLDSQILLRLGPVVCMSLTIALIFYFFLSRHSFWMGGYSLLISFSSFMVWAYWVEARPYALWVLLTTLQSLLFLMLLEKSNKEDVIYKSLVVVHILLSLTVSLGIVQVCAMVFLLWLYRRPSWKCYLGLIGVPLITTIFYYLRSTRYQFWFKEAPLELINASIPKDRMLIIFIFAVCLFLLRFWQKQKSFKIDALRQGIAYLFFVVLMFLGYAGVLALLKLKEVQDMAGFQISNRYFIALTPIGIIATTLFSLALWRTFGKNLSSRLCIVVILAVLMAFRLLKTWGHLHSLYPSLFS